MDIDILEIGKFILTSIFTIIGIVVSVYTAFHSLNKQSRIDISKERLEYVYYPLMNELKSFSYSSTKGFDLYYYLHDRMKDEKYRTLLGSKKLEISFKKLSRIFSEDSSVLNSKEISKIYSGMYEETMRQYEKTKRIIGYDTDYLAKFLYCIAFTYMNLLLFVAFSKNTSNTSIMSIVTILWFIIILSSLLLSLAYAAFYAYKEFPQFKEGFRVTIDYLFKILRETYSRRKRKKEK